MNRPRVSVVIPNYNGLKHLHSLLPSLVAHSPSDAELIVVDDGSTDESVGWIRANYPQVVLCMMPQNGGFCRACNAGLAQARGEIIVALNNDTQVSSGWIEAALPHFADPTIGSVAPLIVKMADPSIIDSAGCIYHVSGWAQDRFHGQVMTPDVQRSCEVFGPTMACAFYRREALEKTGLLPVEYGAYFEDIDLAFRLRWAGFRCIFEPKSQIHHVGSATYQQVARRVTRLMARNEELVYWTNLTGRDLLGGSMLHAGFQMVRLIRHAMTGRLRPFLEGKLEAWQMMSLIRRRRLIARSLSRQFRRPDLHLDWSLNILRRGIRWLRSRRNAG